MFKLIIEKLAAFPFHIFVLILFALPNTLVCRVKKTKANSAVPSEKDSNVMVSMS